VLADGPLVTEPAGATPGTKDPTDLLVVATQGVDFGFPACLRSRPADRANAA